jgi:tetratricopeptide (TPR) repeat protein
VQYNVACTYARLGELDMADQACTRARELEPTNLWGFQATSWVARARGNPAEASRWLEQARKLAPADPWIADQAIDLLLTQGKTQEARALLPQLPGGFFGLAREANIVLVESGAATMRQWLVDHGLSGLAATGAELSELAKLQYVAGDAMAARATLEHAQRVLPMSSADMFDGSQIRHEYSVALFHAGIELKGGGDVAHAHELLAQLDRMLATYEKNGGEHYGLYSLRAASLAMQEKNDEAQAALQLAWQHGWRNTWRARADPYLGKLKIPGGE